MKSNINNTTTTGIVVLSIMFFLIVNTVTAKPRPSSFYKFRPALYGETYFNPTQTNKSQNKEMWGNKASNNNLSRHDYKRQAGRQVFRPLPAPIISTYKYLPTESRNYNYKHSFPRPSGEQKVIRQNPTNTKSRVKANYKQQF